MDEITKFSPAEIIHNDAFLMSGVDLEPVKERMNVSVSVLDSWYMDEDQCRERLKRHFKVSALEGTWSWRLYCRDYCRRSTFAVPL